MTITQLAEHESTVTMTIETLKIQLAQQEQNEQTILATLNNLTKQHADNLRQLAATQGAIAMCKHLIAIASTPDNSKPAQE